MNILSTAYILFPKLSFYNNYYNHLVADFKRKKLMLDESSRKCDNLKQFGKTSAAVKLSQDYCENQRIRLR